MTVPKTSTIDVLHQVYELLEIPSDRWRDVESLRLEAGVWRVRLFRRDGKRPLIVRRGGHARAARETYEICIEQTITSG